MKEEKVLEKKLPKEEIEKIIQMYQHNTSLREIERQTGYCRMAVGAMLERLGIKTTVGNHYRKYFFNFNFFEKIDNELKAYWLGFMYADGCVLPLNSQHYGEQQFKLSLQEEDLETIENFKLDLESTYPIRYDNSKKNSMVLQSLRSQKAVDDLKRLGCVESKSLILTFPSNEQVPSELIYHFIRGYFDGDGSITESKGKYNLNFVGTEAFIKKLSTYFKGGSIYPDLRKTNSWYFNLGGNLQVINAYHLLYDNATRYMKRKYDKFQTLLNKYDENQGI